MNGALGFVRAAGVMLGGVVLVFIGISHFIPSVETVVLSKFVSSLIGLVVLFVPSLGQMLKELRK